MSRNRSPPPHVEQPPYSPIALVNSFSSRHSSGSKRSTHGGVCVTPPLVGGTDIDQLELTRLRSENQRNTRLLEEERRQSADLHRRIAELQRELDHIKVATQRHAPIDTTIPRFVVMNGEGVILTPQEYFGAQRSRGDASSNTSFGSAVSLGRAALSTSSSRSSSPRHGNSREASPEADEHSLRAGKFFVAYLILVERGFPNPPGKIQVLRRFNDFKTLHKRIEKAFPQHPCIPSLPEKKPGALFSKQLNSMEELEQRRRFLEVYLSQLLCIHEVRQSAAIHKFLASNVREPINLSEEALVMDDHDF